MCKSIKGWTAWVNILPCLLLLQKQYYNCILLVFLHFVEFDVCYIEKDVGQNPGKASVLCYRACSNINSFFDRITNKNI